MRCVVLWKEDSPGDKTAQRRTGDEATPRVDNLGLTPQQKRFTRLTTVAFSAGQEPPMQDDKSMDNARLRMFGIAEEAVEKHLGINGCIRAYKEKLYTQLEENYRRARHQAQTNSQFVADCLPLIGGLIQCGTTTEGLEQATAWATTNLRDADPVSALSNLTMLYLVEKGWGEISQSAENGRKQVWLEMRDLMQGLLASCAVPGQ